MKITILIACTDDKLDRLCRIFTNMEAAKTECDEIFGTEGKNYVSGFEYQTNVKAIEKLYPTTSAYLEYITPSKFRLTNICIC